LHRFGADNPTVRISKLSLLIDLVFFMLLALGYVVPVVYSSMSPAVAPFMIVGINLFITKLLFIPTIQKPYRHLVMAGFSDAMKPEKFTGVNFKRWQTRAQLWLSAMDVFWVVSNPPALPLGSEKEVQEFTAATTIFVGCVLSVLSN